MSAPLLAVRDLTVALPVGGEYFPAVDRVSLELAPGECLAVVGESGCGKTMLGRAIAGLPPEQARLSGTILFDGAAVPLSGEPAGRRGVGLVLQDPAAALDPVRTIASQIQEGARAAGREDSRAVARELLSALAIAAPDRILAEHPHRLSGGQKQRASIAAALAARPRLLVLDEPTTALDTTVAAELAALLAGLRRERGLALLWITHDLALAASVADRVLVLYAGRVAEEGEAAALLREPRHPYTRALVSSVPHGAPAYRGERLPAIGGRPPDLAHRSARGCRFAPRCPDRFEPCADREPPEFPVAQRRVACFLYGTGDSGPGTRPSEPASEFRVPNSEFRLP
jgi:peptide/nickel transport system ATP-binding protein